MNSVFCLLSRRTIVAFCCFLLVLKAAWAAPQQEPQGDAAVAEALLTPPLSASSVAALSWNPLRNSTEKRAAADAQASAAAVQAPAQSAPVPTQIATAHTVFLTNAAADPNFPIDPAQAHNDVYALLQTWGRYQLVGAPEQADLVFQLRDIAPITNVSGTDNGVYSVTSPAFQLTMIDPKTNVAIWTITSPVNIGGGKKAYTHWVSVAETNLVSRVKVLAGQPLSTAESDSLTTYPKYHGLRTALIVTGAVVAVGVTGGLLLHHAFENSLADQKKQQDAFCVANNIPLSMCAGG